MNEIGIRQGRLSPSSIGPVQRFPWTSWRDEFSRARDIGFAFIDWLFPADGYEENPLWSDSGQHAIHETISASGTRVCSLCADYFMAHPFVRVAEDARAESIRVLDRLVVQSARAGVRVLVVPLLEAGEIRDRSEMIAVRKSLSRALDLAAAHAIVLALESDVPALAIRSLVDLERHPALGVCYDTGNAAAKGLDVRADLDLLGSDLSVVHVKDRGRHGVSVELGSGSADFPAFFRALADRPSAVPLVLEAARGNDPLASARTNLAFLRAQSSSNPAACLESRATR